MGKKKGRSFNDQVSVIKSRLLARMPFVGHLLLHSKAVESDQVPIAGILPDGTIYINTKRFMEMTEEEQGFVLAHEIFHPAFLFWKRMRGRNRERFNMAHDHCINLILKEWSAKKIISLIPGILCEDKYIGMSAEEVYDKIKTVTVFVGPLSSDCKEGGKGGNSEDATDGGWAGRVARASQFQQMNNGWGKAPAGLKRMVDEILSPKLEWWDLLSRWIGENGGKREYSYRRPGRRSSGVSDPKAPTYLPTLLRQGLADVCVLLDTSGSIGEEMLKDAVAETSGICDELGLSVRVMIVDAQIHDDLEVNDAMEILPMLKGGGGSDYTPAFAKLEEEGFTGAVVAITDGYITVPPVKPEHLAGTLWCLHKGGQRPAQWGEEVVIERGHEKN